MNKIYKIYEKLFNKYGYQGWWPILDEYHKNDYSYPQTKEEQFGIIVETILTQNTSFKNVNLAVRNLKEVGLLDPSKILEVDFDKLGEIIKPSGYFNQKAKRLKLISEFYLSLNGNVPTREQLLELNGVGNETADSILLYAYKVPSFVIDAYTNRIFKSLGLVKDDIKYMELKDMIEKNIPKDYKVYNEFHALLVCHAKEYYTKGKMKEDFLKDML